MITTYAHVSSGVVPWPGHFPTSDAHASWNFRLSAKNSEITRLQTLILNNVTLSGWFVHTVATVLLPDSGDLPSEGGVLVHLTSLDDASQHFSNGCSEIAKGTKQGCGP